jgi:hypothetical protein
MLTPQDYIREKPELIWMHGLDALKHCLKGDISQTAYKDKKPQAHHLGLLKEELGIHKNWDATFEEVKETTFIRDFEIVETPSDVGELDIDAYINHDELLFEECIKVEQEDSSEAITIIMDMGIAGSERDGSEMVERHKKTYELCLKAEADDVPIRVIGAAKLLSDRPKKVIKIYLVIKDYEDPIFPAIWGAFKTNKSTNDFMNVFMDYMVGIHDSGNGAPVDLRVTDDIWEDEIILINPKRIHK